MSSSATWFSDGDSLCFPCARKFTVVMPMKDQRLHPGEGRMNCQSPRSWLKQILLFIGQERVFI